MKFLHTSGVMAVHASNLISNWVSSFMEYVEGLGDKDKHSMDRYLHFMYFMHFLYFLYFMYFLCIFLYFWYFLHLFHFATLVAMIYLFHGFKWSNTKLHEWFTTRYGFIRWWWGKRKWWNWIIWWWSMLYLWTVRRVCKPSIMSVNRPYSLSTVHAICEQFMLSVSHPQHL